MFLKLFLFIGLLSFNNPGLPAPDGSVIDLKGTVVEELTGDPLTGVTITIVELNKDLITDFDGNFSLSGIKPGSYHIKASLASFKSADLDKVSLNKNSDPLLIALK